MLCALQLQYSPAFVQGLSGGDGEYAERLNAELSPYNSTVKNMSTAGKSGSAYVPDICSICHAVNSHITVTYIAGSQDRITEIVCGIGARKRSAQPDALVLRCVQYMLSLILRRHWS